MNRKFIWLQPENFKEIREDYLYLTTEQVGAALNIDASVIEAIESGYRFTWGTRIMQDIEAFYWNLYLKNKKQGKLIARKVKND